LRRFWACSERPPRPLGRFIGNRLLRDGFGRLRFGNMPGSRRFPPPWRIEETAEAFAGLDSRAADLLPLCRKASSV
jgi:hypothetical protein